MINKKQGLTLVILALSGILLLFFTKNNAKLYRQPIGKVMTVKQQTVQKNVDEFGNHDVQTTQLVTLKILNGHYANKKVTVNNTFAKSEALSQKYRPGQEVFLDIHRLKDGQLSITLSNLKRDVYLIFLVWLVVVVLYLMMRMQGLKTLLSVILNVLLFLFFIQLDVALNLNNFFWLFALSAVLFTLLSLSLVIGLNKQCLVTFLAVILATSSALGLSMLLIAVTGQKGIHYEALDFATQAPKQLFLSATVIGLLGAVMDAATDIVSTLFELKQTNPNVSQAQLFKSGRQVGQAVMGPLINVLLLIFFAESFALSVLYLRNGNTFAYTFEWTMSLGILEALISAIGVVLVIPSASLLAAMALGGKKDVVS